MSFGTIFPIGLCDLADIEQQFTYIHRPKVVIAALAGEVLNALDGLRAVFSRFNDDVETAFDLLRVAGAL